MKLRAAQILLPAASLLAFLTIWQIVGSRIDPLLFAPPTRVWEAAQALWASGELVEAGRVTLGTLTVGYVLAILVGLPVGIAMGSWRRIGDLVSPYFYGIFSTPRVVVVPLVIVWLGVGFPARVFLVFLWSMIAVASSTADGVRNARPDLIEVSRSFGTSMTQRVRHVILPGSIPFVLSGLKVGAERAVVGVVIAEMFLQLTGLGGLLQERSQRFDTAGMLVAVAVIAIIGTILITLLDLLEQQFSTWKKA